MPENKNDETQQVDEETPQEETREEEPVQHNETGSYEDLVNGGLTAMENSEDGEG
jgi:hypothetical protein